MFINNQDNHIISLSPFIRNRLKAVKNNKVMALQKSNIELDGETTKRALKCMAVMEDQSLQRFIETQLTAMGKVGITYLELWNKYQIVENKLKSLNQ